MLKPGGSFSFAIGSLSAAAAIGGGATGASFAAASLSAGRPISGEPGGSGAAAAGAAAAGAAAGGGTAAGAGVAGCCAVAATVNDVKKAPASRARRAVEWIMLKSPWLEILVRKLYAAAFLPAVSDISRPMRNRKSRQSSVPGCGIVRGIQDGFGIRKLQHDVSFLVADFHDRAQQVLTAFRAEQFPDRPTRHVPGLVGVAQVLALRIEQQ